MLLFGIFLLFLTFIIGFPIWLSLTIGAVSIGLLYSGMSPQDFPNTFLGSMDSFLLLAVPFFMFGGNIMARCGPAKYLFEAIDGFVGHIRGGMAFATILTCMFFGAITGSTLATLVAVGTITIPQLVNLGYPKGFCLGMLCVSATLGQIIPPSIYMILYGSYVQESAALLFAGGLIPGLIIGCFLAVLAMIMIRKKSYGVKRDPLPYKERWRRFIAGLPAILMPVLVLGGIYTGIFTPTEAAAVACVYAIAISHFVYKQLNKESFFGALRGTLSTTSMIFLIVAAAVLIAKPLTLAQIPQNLTKFLIQLGFGKTGFLLLSVALFLSLGCFLDPLPILYLTVPIMYSSLITLDINLIHFCVITIICMQIAQITPPFGVSLFTVSQVWNEPIESVVKETFPFLILLIIMLPIFLFMPFLSTWLPSLM